MRRMQENGREKSGQRFLPPDRLSPSGTQRPDNRFEAGGRQHA
jgi:hypothetical protein